MSADAAGVPPAHIAKGALRRLAQAKKEPTPENFARAYAEESGPAGAQRVARGHAVLERMSARIVEDAALRSELVDALAHGQWEVVVQAWERVAAVPAPWAGLFERLARGLERGGRQWSAARKKESLQRVLDGSGNDPMRLQQRMQSLLQAWESDTALAPIAGEEATPAPTQAALAETCETASAPIPDAAEWPKAAAALQLTVRAALPASEPRAVEIADELGAQADRLARDGATPARVREVDALCQRARRWLSHRHHLFDSLGRLCGELGQSLTDLAEDESWARGQSESLQARLADGITARSVRTVTELLAETRLRQRQLRAERDGARDALKGFIQRLLNDLGELGTHTDRFQDQVGRHADAIERADSLESLAGVVRELVDESRAVQSVVRQTQERIRREHSKADELEARVRELEGEMRRLSAEVSTDALTQVANRRGLAQAFDAERARADRDQEAPLSVGLIDIDNFKKLNDALGHAAGDEALKALAATVRERLRPVDTVARFGGEEFVVLIPGTPVDEGRQTLNRLQRSLSAGLFMHEGQDVFVTFSAGVTQWRAGETLETCLERADEALYEAKRTGKNRTCVA